MIYANNFMIQIKKELNFTVNKVLFRYMYISSLIMIILC